jgi:para-nitrobenzyl esterase
MKRLPLVFVMMLIIVFASAQMDTIKTDAGFISGTINNDKAVHIYKGIPFAAPPVVELRWKAPQPVAHWQGIKKCDAFAASPMQNKPVPFMMYTAPYLIPASPISEDCLYLNVWTSAKSDKEKKPVLVWIYGGGFVSGGTACAIYDGENMAKKDVVFVSIPYRVGVFGFLAHPELTKESNTNSSGNYALLDQIAALHWIQKNIAAFGGDPDNVTIDGQSAGAFSVNALVASPLAKGLFKKAIAESGAMFSADGRSLSLHDAEKNGEAFMQKINISSIKELRKISADSLQKLSRSFAASPVIDGYVLPKDVYTIFNSGEQNDVTVLTGWNGDDGFPESNIPDAKKYAENAKEKYGALANEYLQAFPGNTSDEISKSLFALNRDNLFAWQAYTWAKLQTTKGHHNVYVYLFNRTAPGEEKYGAFHSSEIPFALDNLQTWNLEWTNADKKLADITSDYWVNFAKTGNPNGASLPGWKPFSVSENKVMNLNIDEQSMQPIAVKNQFNFLDKYQSYLRAKKK